MQLKVLLGQKHATLTALIGVLNSPALLSRGTSDEECLVLCRGELWATKSTVSGRYRCSPDSTKGWSKRTPRCYSKVGLVWLRGLVLLAQKS